MCELTEGSVPVGQTLIYTAGEGQPLTLGDGTSAESHSAQARKPETVAFKGTPRPSEPYLRHFIASQQWQGRDQALHPTDGTFKIPDYSMKHSSDVRRRKWLERWHMG